MDSQSAVLLIQLLNTMKETMIRFEKVYNEGDYEKVVESKRELIELQKRVGNVI